MFKFLKRAYLLDYVSLNNGGNDRLGGASGNDHLDGGANTDYGNGGKGSDTCVNIETETNCEA
jgi:hypothetical protein